MKRLAKLGGGQSNSNNATPSTTMNGTTSTPDEPSATSTSAPDAAKIESPPTSNVNPFTQMSMTNSEQGAGEKKATPQIKVHPRPASPAKRPRADSERPRSQGRERPAEAFEVWQDRNLRQIFRVTLKPEEIKDTHGHPLIFLPSTREEAVDAQGALMLSTEVLEGAITEAASQAPDNKPFEYLLQCFKRVSRAMRNTKYSGPEDPKHDALKETRRLCMSYCIFAVTMPQMFNEDAPSSNPLVDHLFFYD